MANFSKEDWAGWSSRLQAFCAAAKELTAGHDPDQQLQQHLQLAKELVAEADAVMGAIHSRPDLAISLTVDTQVTSLLYR